MPFTWWPKVPAGRSLRYCWTGIQFRQKENRSPGSAPVTIKVNGEAIQLPATPVRSTNANGITGYDIYEAYLCRSRRRPRKSRRCPHPRAMARESGY